MMISSVQNARVKAVVKLQRQGRERRQRGLFCIEAKRELTRATAAGFAIAELYYTSDWQAEAAERRAIVEQAHAAGAFVSAVSDAVLGKIAYREKPQGFVAVMRARRRTLQELQPRPEQLLVVCSGVEKPGNVGAIVRSAAGAGVAAVIVDHAAFDLFNPNCIRASTGAVFSLPIMCAERQAVIDWLREHDRTVAALSPEGQRAYTQVDWRTRQAIVLGAEAEGLDAAWRAAADELVSIPLATLHPTTTASAANTVGGVDSLNVSVAAAVVMFEAKRQREA